MSLKRKPLVSLLMILTIISTSESRADLKQIELQKGQPAPFHGALVPPDIFETYQVKIFEADRLGQRLSECQESLDEAQKPRPDWIGPLYFLAGVAVGGLALKVLR